MLRKRMFPIVIGWLCLTCLQAKADFLVSVPADVMDFDKDTVTLKLDSGRTARVARKELAVSGPLRPGMKVTANVPLSLLGTKISFEK